MVSANLVTGKIALLPPASKTISSKVAWNTAAKAAKENSDRNRRSETPSNDRRQRADDGRRGRRLRNDEVFRRPEGGGRKGGHTDNDWAGRAILGRYLNGGGNWTIKDNTAWSNYMMNNQSLRTQLLGPSQGVAQQALSNYQNGNGSTGSFNQTFHAEIENGEGMVGYQYLHGTDANKGDFQFGGNTEVKSRSDGNYEVTIHGGYTWNDTIDPNPKYSTDRWKSAIAEVATLGKADAYDLHITWHADTTVVLDKNGNVLDIKGYPAP